MGRRRALRAVGVAGLAVVLTGCMKIDMDLTVNTDDTVDGVMIMAIDRSLAEMSGDAESMVEEMLGGDDEIPEGATAERYEDDNFLGAEYTFADVPLAELQFDEADSESLSIVREGDEFVASGALDLSSAGEDMGEMPPGLADGLMDSMEVRIAITFPGEVIEASGEIEGTTVTWTPQVGERVEIQARAKESGGAGLPLWAWIVIGVVVVAVIAALLFFLARSRKTEADPVTAGAGTPDSAAAAGQEQSAGFPPPPAPSGPAAAAGAAAAAASTGGPPAASGDADTTADLDHPDDDPDGTVAASTDEPQEAGADAVGPVEDVPPAPTTFDEPTTFASDVTSPSDDGLSSPDDAGAEPPSAPPAPEPPAAPAEGPDDVTTVDDAPEPPATDAPSADPDSDSGGDDSLQPPR